MALAREYAPSTCSSFCYFCTKTSFGYSLKLPRLGNSSENSKDMFPCKNKKNKKTLKCSPYLELWRMPKFVHTFAVWS